MTRGRFIKTRRLQLNLTLEDVGKACGVGKSTVRKWETGMIQHMKLDKVTALARVLDIDPMELILEDGDDGNCQEITVRQLAGVSLCGYTA